VRHLYTCLYEASDEGQTCYDPLFFHYPLLEEAYAEMENTFLVGEAIKVSPVLEPNAEVIKSYFPNGEWVNLNNYSDILKVNDPSGGQSVPLTIINEASSALVAKHLRPGKLIPFQDNSAKNIMTTANLQGVNITLLVSRNSNGHADGKVFLDQGETRSELINQEFEYYEF
jgi:alpha-glucosidase